MPLGQSINRAWMTIVLRSAVKNSGDIVGLAQIQIAVHARIVCPELIELGVKFYSDEMIVPQKGFYIAGRALRRGRLGPCKAAQEWILPQYPHGLLVGLPLPQIPGDSSQMGPIDVGDKSHANFIALYIRNEKIQTNPITPELADVGMDVNDPFGGQGFLSKNTHRPGDGGK